MAQMHPDRIRPDVKSQVEVTLYHALAHQLPTDWHVFHSVAWQVPSLRSGARDGEADFILAHPQYGIYIVEVKGGRIHYAAASAQWSSSGHPIKDPFLQATDNKHNFRRL